MFALLHTIAGNDEELVIVSKIVSSDVGERRHDLLLRGKVCALLEFEISNGSTERQVAIDSAKVDESAGCTYTCLLALVLRLVIERERLGPTLDAKD